MGIQAFGRRALGSLAGLLLAGCGGSSTGVTMPPATTGASAHQASATSGDLLYGLAHGGPAGWTLRAFTFPGGQPVSTQRVEASGGLCSDASGNIFIPRAEGIDEYAHGGKHPIETFSDPDANGFNCAVDPTTGNLAVTNFSRQTSTSGNVAIYKNAKGPPTIYVVPQMYYYESCGYDNNGNLFVDGAAAKTFNAMLEELPKGSKSFVNITIDKGVYGGPLQWDGQYLAIQGDPKHIYRVQISGSTGTVVQTILLRHTRGIREFWIQGNIIAATSWNSAIYNYPRGGKPILFFFARAHVGVGMTGVTVSVASSRK